MGFTSNRCWKLLQAVIVCNFKKKRLIQTQENGKKTHFRPDLGTLDWNSGRQNFFQKSGFVSHKISWLGIIM